MATEPAGRVYESGFPSSVTEEVRSSSVSRPAPALFHTNNHAVMEWGAPGTACGKKTGFAASQMIVLDIGLLPFWKIIGVGL